MKPLLLLYLLITAQEGDSLYYSQEVYHEEYPLSAYKGLIKVYQDRIVFEAYKKPKGNFEILIEDILEVRNRAIPMKRISIHTKNRKYLLAVSKKKRLYEILSQLVSNKATPP